MIRAEILPNPLTKMAELVLLDDQGDKTFFLEVQERGAMWKCVELDPAAFRTDLHGIVLPHGAVEAIADALARIGVRTNHDARIEGTLIATRAHLEDMRALVFKP